jgi:hypothetical protein
VAAILKASYRRLQVLKRVLQLTIAELLTQRSAHRSVELRPHREGDTFTVMFLSILTNGYLVSRRNIASVPRSTEGGAPEAPAPAAAVAQSVSPPPPRPAAAASPPAAAAAASPPAPAARAAAPPAPPQAAAAPAAAKVAATPGEAAATGKLPPKATGARANLLGDIAKLRKG